MWECGLKRNTVQNSNKLVGVTPYVGVWIETFSIASSCFAVSVTPYVGVWIETCGTFGCRQRDRSLLMWECGLKLACSFYLSKTNVVTPYVGVWIETLRTS